MRTYVLLATISLSGCAALNPNPNIGMRSADLAFSGGDCERAKVLVSPASDRGEPWALYRMGMYSVDKKCSPIDKVKAVRYLERAAQYESKTLWEKGNELVIGPDGYFNARASSTNAAYALAKISLELKMPGIAWLAISRAKRQYEPSEPEYQKLDAAAKNIESHYPPDLTKNWEEDAIKKNWRWAKEDFLKNEQ